MDKAEARKTLEAVADGSKSVDDALLTLKLEPFVEVGDYAKVDMHRGLRQGVPEIIYGAGKSPEQILGIAKAMLDKGQETVLITRLSREAAEENYYTYGIREYYPI